MCNIMPLVSNRVRGTIKSLTIALAVMMNLSSRVILLILVDSIQFSPVTAKLSARIVKASGAFFHQKITTNQWLGRKEDQAISTLCVSYWEWICISRVFL